MFILLLRFIASKVQLSLTDERKFVQWMRINNNFYTGDEYYLRLGIFLSNARYCQEYNRKKGLTFRLGLNKFSCHTPAEYKSILGARKVQNKDIRSSISTKITDIPDSFDWRDKGVVNPIKDQADCGSCWAFSAISTSESAYSIATGVLYQFSEQDLIDCSPLFGCSGGWPTDALSFIMEVQYGQFMTEQDYPYRALDCACQLDYSKLVGKITSIQKVSEGDENDLKEKVATYGVASVCIAAGNTPFMSYAGGILDNDSCSDEIDHAVAVIGYGSENEVDYWIVRNSWGTSWGEDGYVRMVRNKNNQCSIASVAIVAIDSE